MSALDWIPGEEGVINGQVLETDEIITTEDSDNHTEDIGPAPLQVTPPQNTGDEVPTFGYIDTGAKAPLSERDQHINNELQDSVTKSSNKKHVVMDWPAVSKAPISEYSDTRIFVNAFPWLFPGGVGDVKDFPGKQLKDWGKLMLYYEDGRFAADSLFGFFALNYIIRNRNSSSGNWFINNFQKNCPDTVEELKARIEAGDTSFINSLTYYSQRVKGSTSYWFKKRMELYSWINYHVENGDGPPTFFITLSCAEYLWKDVAKLIKERMTIAGEDVSRCYVGSEEFGGYVNKYCIVVQEFFQKRVTTWLDTVGKDVFNIKHYWIRYEFAPGRGQIHAHLLAIPDNHRIFELCHLDMQDKENGPRIRNQRLQEWAMNNLGLTASVRDPDEFDNLKVDNSNSPCKHSFTDVSATKKTMETDFTELMKHVQEHKCSGFCMRENKDIKT